MLPQDELPDTTNLLRNRKDKDLGSQRSSKSNQTVLVTEDDDNDSHRNHDDEDDDDDYDDYVDRATTYSNEVSSETLSTLSFWQRV